MKDLLKAPDIIEWLGVSYNTILSTATSGGGVSVVDTTAPPLSGPPRHVHDDADETFVMLSGAVEVWLEGKTWTIGAGETAFIPRGREHTFRVTADGPAHKLLVLTPGGFEGFFAEMAAGQFAIPADMPAIEEAAARYHLRFTGPPLGA